VTDSSKRADRPRLRGIRGGLAEEMTRRLERVTASSAAAAAGGVTTDDYAREIAELEARLSALRAGDDIAVARWELPRDLRYIVGGRAFVLRGDKLTPAEPQPRPGPAAS